jgi:hypothetical protein
MTTLQEVFDGWAEDGLTEGQAWLIWRADTVFLFRPIARRRTDYAIITYESPGSSGGIYERRCASSGLRV